MGKKPAPEPVSKKQKQKHKEMFTQLATKQQEIVQTKYNSQSVHRPHHKRVMHDDSQQQVELDVLQRQTNNLDAICDAVHKLLSKNKVSAKNAFDVPLIDLEQLPDFSESLQNEYAWKRLSATLESDYKIYGYRVDAIHSITYNILHTMSRRQQDIQLQKIQPQPEPSIIEHQSIKIGDNTIQEEYLQKKIQNLNITELELALGMDPILQRTKRQFDLLGQSSMMLNTLPIDMALRLQLVNNKGESQKYPPYGTYTDEWRVDDPLMAFVDLANFRQKFEQNYEGKIKNEQYEQLLYDQKQNDFNGYNSNAAWEQSYTGFKKAITQEIQFKHRIFRNDKDLIEDAENWMGDIDRKFLGITSKKGRIDTIAQVKNETKLEDLADMIDFSAPDVQQNTRAFVFRSEPDKMEHREEIEDRFLLAPKLVQPFSIAQHTLFLKEMIQPQEDIYQNNHDVEVDVRRQMISILQAKKKIKEQLHTRSTFKTIYSNFSEAQEISPALCFLTVLHLANEQELALEQIDETNFYVR